MRNQPKLSIRPLPCSDEAAAALIGSTLEDVIDSGHTAFIQIGQQDAKEHAFVSRDPDHALRWLCERVPKPTLLRVINYNYDHPSSATLEEEEEEDREELDQQSETFKSRSGSAGLKRKREMTSMQVNRALVKKMNEQLVKTVASTQDYEDARATCVPSNEEQKYRSYVASLPKIGVSLAAQMMRQAEAVGSMEVFKDWSAVLAVWKRQVRYGRGLLDTVASDANWVPATEMSTIPNSAFSSSIATTLQEDDTAKFKKQYFELDKLEADSITGRMLKRYKLDQFYEQFEALDTKIRLQKTGTGRRGVRYDSVAKEILFASTYAQDLGREPDRDRDRDLWAKFGEKLDKGKRWNMIKRRLGSVGVFGLLPHSYDPDTFIEQRLTQGRVGQWIEMVAACNEDAKAMALRMEPLFLACVQDHPPPNEYGFLEDVDHIDQSIKPLAFLARADVEEIGDSEEGEED